MNSYTSSMTAGGYAYLDIGMLWGARLFAPNGLSLRQQSDDLQ